MLWERIFLVLAHLLVVVLLVSSLPPQPDCYTSYGQRIKNEITHSCSLRKSENVVPNISDWNPPKEEFQLNLKDSKHGIVTAKFPIPDTLIDFEVTLLMNESAKTEDECKKSHIHQEFVTHSRKVINRNHCSWMNESSTCSSCASVYVETELHNVFTGCYMLKVRPNRTSVDNPMLKLNRYSHSIFIKSIYQKTFIQTPNMSYEYNPHANVAFINITSSWIGKIPLLVSMGYIEREAGNQSCQTSGIVQSCCSSKMPNVTVQQCETNNPNHRHPECDPEAIGLSCRIFNVTPGNYCIRAEVLNDDRCDSSSVWTQKSHSCVWIYNLVAAKGVAPTEIPDVSPDSSIFYIYIGLGAAASLAFFAAVIHAVKYFRRYLSYNEGGTKPHWTPRIFPRDKILLLYACDCSPFMDLMTTFRKILQKVSSWEVCDVFDPHQWNEIAIGRQEWIQRLLSEDDTVIIIVDSTSAVLHQNALENNYIINYFQPRPNSDLFTYALQMITNNIQRNVYKKIFVVRFSGFSEDGQTLRHIAPLRRYILPDHFHQLLSSLKETSYLSFEEGSEEDLRDVWELQKCLDNLILYKSNNPKYLKSVLYRT
ncbi:uncharacterized protein LOC124619758 isoform X1 [Schistocerca americana]|uniref:uncharacterized protein LOC124619758 isoform X1 n=1 Tax=Schistocerca americana TaxID=7009 RepID=UPI001F4FFB9C|nr:uncharacterized protein LOC124619758 isoform X1 [Schistocerca americana]XP_047002294.1 uncharacterized protein LOC124619758 isoform X1 [Schistocerca americana]XP_049940406.1 uncharacterized protein LOC126416653 isoform X1 [Schistocerca serialis cubense]XP_049940407.1 uncharacterized protein LOC126416653 isoform X1 [Schistocerca serialis cubense]